MNAGRAPRLRAGAMGAILRAGGQAGSASEVDGRAAEAENGAVEAGQASFEAEQTARTAPAWPSDLLEPDHHSHEYHTDAPDR